MIKKVSCLFLLAVIVFAAVSCSDGKAITGDVKNGEEYPWVSQGITGDSSNHSATLIPEALVPSFTDENNQDLSNNEPSDEDSAAVKLVETLGYLKEDGRYIEDARAFAKAVAESNAEMISAYTGGVADNYSFLKEIEISDYSVYPFEFNDEMTAEQLTYGKAICVEDCYMVSFTVAESNNEDYPVGEVVRFMGFVSDPVTECRLVAFVAPEFIEEAAFKTLNTDFTDEAAIEFSSLYAPRLSDGEYNPGEFDLTESVHLITHLMDKRRVGGSESRYTLDEVNAFIYEAFNTNPGLGTDIEKLSDSWTVSIESDNLETDEISDETESVSRQDIVYLSGCGTECEKLVPEYIMEKTEGENSVEYTISLFADYSHFAVSKRLVLTFETVPGSVPRLVSVKQFDSTGKAVAYTIA